MKQLLSVLLLIVISSVGVAAQAQQPGRIFRIALLAYDQQRSNMESFFAELRGLGYDRNVSIVLWNAEGRADNLTKLTEEVVHFKPDVVVASATPAALAAKKSLLTTPIVFALVADPLGAGLVASFAKPGGNLTGLTNLNVELSGKRAELLMEAFPSARTIGVLTNPADPIGAPQLKEVRRAAQARRVKVGNPKRPRAEGSQRITRRACKGTLGRHDVDIEPAFRRPPSAASLNGYRNQNSDNLLDRCIRRCRRVNVLRRECP